MDTQKHKQEQLSDFIDKYKNLPEQLSVQWLSDRKLTIGGSEMSTITGTNPYGNIKSLIKNHLGLTTFYGNINTYWGSIFENLVTIILEKIWCCKIYETGSLPGSINFQKYSPDGLLYLDFLDKLVLLEIKSPIKRIATYNTIPGMYKPQIYTGLDTIGIADMAIFIDAMFRRSSLKDFKFNKIYDKTIHSNHDFVDDPIALCMVYMYETTINEDEINEDYITLKSEQPIAHGGIIDAGLCDAWTLGGLLNDSLKGKLSYSFSSIITEAKDGTDISTAETQLITEFKNMCFEKKYNPVAVLPVKLFQLETVPLYRNDWKTEVGIKYNKKLNTDSTFVENWQDDIKRIIGEIEVLEKLNVEEQLIAIEKLYPPKRRGVATKRTNTTTAEIGISNELSNDLIKSLFE
jgi:hypothetical protein